MMMMMMMMNITNNHEKTFAVAAFIIVLDQACTIVHAKADRVFSFLHTLVHNNMEVCIHTMNHNE